MGLLQINRQILLIAGGFIAFIAICIVGVIATSQREAPRADEATTYTSSITGRESIIFLDKGRELGGNVPGVELFAAEDFYDRYTTVQAASIIQQLHAFVDTVSAGRATVAGIVDGKINNKDADTDTFKLFINQPESTFEVTVVTLNSNQQIPTVTFAKE